MSEFFEEPGSTNDMTNINSSVSPPSKPICLVCGVDLEIPGSQVGDSVQFACCRCGNYGISGSLTTELVNGSTQIPTQVSSWLRQQGPQGAVQLLTTENLPRIVDSLPRFSVRQKMHMTMQMLERKTESPGAEVHLHLHGDGALVWVNDAREMDFLIQSLEERGLVRRMISSRSSPILSITAHGWEYLDEQSHQDLLATQGFVAMWFDDSLQSAYDLAIAPAIVNTGYHPYRVDRDHHGERIDARITNAIDESRFVVADVTGQRPSVYFEAGYALALGKPVIWTVREDALKHVAFDTRQYPHIIWSDIAGFRTDLEQLMRARLGETQKRG